MTETVPYWERCKDHIASDMDTEDALKQARSTLKHFAVFLKERDLEPENVEALDILSYLNKLKNTYTKVTTYNMYRHLGAYFRALEIERIIVDNPVDEAEKEYDDEIKPDEWSTSNPKKVEEQGESVIELDSDKIDQMVREADSIRDKLIIQLLRDTGLRASELCSVTVKQIEEGREHRKIENIQIAKRDGAEKTVYYTNRTDSLLTEYLNVGRKRYKPASESPYLLVSLRSEQIHPNWLNRIVRQTARDAGVQEIMFTDAKGDPRYRYVAQHFRSNFAIKYISDGGNVEFLRQMLGHADLETTEEAYLSFKEKSIRESYRDVIG
ncbi:Site-specific recombinase XerD [Halobiforma haloterrestris]|uniref:Site-specific recombinase XerD n=1 Tax=Natronobacterium haloterrestre TaxID=148448 RepID=A0A1I1HS19_NATHA|nr:site-specific integrase [Halobiforma haloterrestris]SFC24213.1 Site-specific recombinase XerD [Halobiforma haloterrestris]